MAFDTVVPTRNAETQLRQQSPGKWLLLAEDNPINREVALELLHGVGMAVDTAMNGREAIDKARHGRYDLILMDMQMPVMDGMDATRVIRTLPGWANRPILALTANAFNEDREQCLKAGMDDFIVKPFGARELVTMSWGFVLPQPGKAPRRVTNTRDDKVQSSFWRGSGTLNGPVLDTSG